jgi:hypothetical protein
MPSSVVVTDRSSLAQNFSENAKSVLCQATFGAGAYAIGGRLLGLPPITPASALVTGGALLAALTLCPSSADGGDVFGQPPNFSGGQCPVLYDFTYSKSDSVISPAQGRIDANIQGPIRGVAFTTGNNGPGSLQWYSLRIFDGPTTLYFFDRFAFTAQGGNCTFAFVRNDNLPDNCGNAPNVGGQIITNNTTGDTIDNSSVVNNSNFSTVIPVLFNVGGINNSLNLKFGDIQIEKLLPIEFNIDIGGSRFKFREKPDGDLEPVGINPEQEAANDRIEGLLKGIKECVCNSPVEMSELFLPVVAANDSCDVISEKFLVPKGSVGSSVVDKFVTSAVLASQQCDSLQVEQLPESQIFSATTSSGGGEIFTDEIGTEVVSLRLKITDFDEESLGKIGLYPDSNQYKFGSVNYCSADGAGGGDYIYVFDNSTYIPLPPRGKKGRLRILLKPGTSFIVYDTGERI